IVKTMTQRYKQENEKKSDNQINIERTQQQNEISLVSNWVDKYLSLDSEKQKELLKQVGVTEEELRNFSEETYKKILNFLRSDKKNIESEITVENLSRFADGINGFLNRVRTTTALFFANIIKAFFEKKEESVSKELEISIKEIQDIAKKYGVNLFASNTDIEGLKKLLESSPVIAHLNMDNKGVFVIITQIKDNNVIFIDENGKERNLMSVEEFAKKFSGKVLALNQIGTELDEKTKKETKGTFFAKLVASIKEIFVIEKGTTIQLQLNRPQNTAQQVIQSIESWLKEYLNADPSKKARMAASLGLSVDQLANLSLETVQRIINYLKSQGDNIINCAVQALTNLFRSMSDGIANIVDVGNIAFKSILVDILTGNLNTNDSQLQLSMFAIATVAKNDYGIQLNGAQGLTLQDLAKIGSPFIAHVGGNHYVVVTSIKDGVVTYIDADGKEYKMSEEEFAGWFTGNILTKEEVELAHRMNFNEMMLVKGARDDEGGRRGRSGGSSSNSSGRSSSSSQQSSRPSSSRASSSSSSSQSSGGGSSSSASSQSPRVGDDGVSRDTIDEATKAMFGYDRAKWEREHQAYLDARARGMGDLDARHYASAVTNNGISYAGGSPIQLWSPGTRPPLPQTSLLQTVFSSLFDPKKMGNTFEDRRRYFADLAVKMNYIQTGSWNGAEDIWNNAYWGYKEEQLAITGPNGIQIENVTVAYTAIGLISVSDAECIYTNSDGSKVKGVLLAGARIDNNKIIEGEFKFSGTIEIKKKEPQSENTNVSAGIMPVVNTNAVVVETENSYLCSNGIVSIRGGEWAVMGIGATFKAGSSLGYFRSDGTGRVIKVTSGAIRLEGYDSNGEAIYVSEGGIARTTVITKTKDENIYVSIKPDKDGQFKKITQSEYNKLSDEEKANYKLDHKGTGKINTGNINYVYNKNGIVSAYTVIKGVGDTLEGYGKIAEGSIIQYFRVGKTELNGRTYNVLARDAEGNLISAGIYYKNVKVVVNASRKGGVRYEYVEDEMGGVRRRAISEKPLQGTITY
ncbi:MAG: cysteine peptidase family C39 domain-containing protein, partial [Candidatus Omnitrophica bacterium]|nr:cysteine peptidase family C39 domain-containing protein [Candidatus Omnitrophota bacterium]